MAIHFDKTESTCQRPSEATKPIDEPAQRLLEDANGSTCGGESSGALAHRPKQLGSELDEKIDRDFGKVEIVSDLKGGRLDDASAGVERIKEPAEAFGALTISRQEFDGEELPSKEKTGVSKKEAEFFGESFTFAQFDGLDQTYLLLKEPVAVRLGEQPQMDGALVARVNDYLQQKHEQERSTMLEADRNRLDAERKDFEQFVDRHYGEWYQNHTLSGQIEQVCQEPSMTGNQDEGLFGTAKEAGCMVLSGVLEFGGITDFEKSQNMEMVDRLKGMPADTLEKDRLMLGLATANFLPGLGSFKKFEKGAEMGYTVATIPGLREKIGNKLLSAFRQHADDGNDAVRALEKIDTVTPSKTAAAGSLEGANLTSKASKDVPSWWTRFQYDKMPDEFPAVGDGKDTYIYLRKDQIDQILEKGSLDGTAKGRSFGTDSPDITADWRSELKTGLTDLDKRQYRIKVTGDAAKFYGDIEPTGPITGYKAAMHQRTSVAPGYDFKFDPAKVKLSEDGFTIEINQGSLKKMPEERYWGAIGKDTGSLVGNLAGDSAMLATGYEAATGFKNTASALEWLLDAPPEHRTSQN